MSVTPTAELSNTEITPGSGGRLVQLDVLRGVAILLVMFRHALVLAGGVEASCKQCEALLEAALEACERYFQAFQFVVWAGKSAREAMDTAMFDTSGEA